MHTDQQETISFAEAGRILGVSRERVRQYVEEERLQVVIEGKRPKVYRNQIEHFVKNKNELKRVRQSLQQDVHTAITEIQTSPKDYDSPGKLLGKVVQTLVDSQGSHTLISNLLHY